VERAVDDGFGRCALAGLLEGHGRPGCRLRRMAGFGLTESSRPGTCQQTKRKAGEKTWDLCGLPRRRIINQSIPDQNEIPMAHVDSSSCSRQFPILSTVAELQIIR